MEYGERLRRKEEFEGEKKNTKADVDDENIPPIRGNVADIDLANGFNSVSFK